MKKLGITLLAAALSLPLAFAAKGQGNTPSTTSTSSKVKAKKHTKRHHRKAGVAAHNAAAKPAK